MQRTRYVRFFLSSTFEDMKLERDVMHSLESYLRDKYAPLGWQVEMVDLRWGINHQTALNNQTMRVCLKELERCQELSPKPNFIVLCGERYGWMPIPETISSDDMTALENIATSREAELLDSWYEYADCIFSLKGRVGRWANDKCYESDVVAPLRSLFARYAEGLPTWLEQVNFVGSATAQEIAKGMFASKENIAHAVAYVRTIINIPESSEGDVLRSESECSFSMQRRVRGLLMGNVPSSQVYNPVLDYTEYCSDDYKHRFYDEMLERVESVVKQVIEENKVSDDVYERGLHRNVMDLGSLAYMERPLSKVICQWVGSEIFYENRKEDILCISGASGTGKTTLLAGIASHLAKNGSDVVFRSVGTTHQSVDSYQLLLSIWNEILSLYPARRAYESFPPKDNYIYLMSSKLSSKPNGYSIASLQRPLYIIIDGIDKVRRANAFHSLEWLEHPFHSSIRVLISTTDEFYVPEFSKVFRHHDIRHFYLGDRPAASGNLSLKMMVESLVLVDGFDRDFINLTFTLFFCERQGFTDEEMCRILARDEVLYGRVMADNHHKWTDCGDRRLPTMVWSRLFESIRTFFTFKDTRVGMRWAFKHDWIRDAVGEMIVKSDATLLARAYSALFRYYEAGFFLADLHSVSECLASAASLLSVGRGQDTDDVREFLRERSRDIDFFAFFASRLSNRSLVEDLEEIIRHSGEDEDWGLSLRNVIVDLLIMPQASTPEDFVSFALRLPRRCYLWGLAQFSECRSGLMDNALAEADWRNRVLATFHCPEIVASNEGLSKVLTLSNNHRTVAVYDIESDSCVCKFVCGEHIRQIKSTPSLSHCAILTESDNFILYDFSARRVMTEQTAGIGVFWISLSDDAGTFAFGGADGASIYASGKSWSFSNKTTSGCLSPSGRYLWFTLDGGEVERFDFVSERNIGLPSDNTMTTPYRVVSGTDEYVALSSDDILTLCRVVRKEDGSFSCLKRFLPLRSPIHKLAFDSQYENIIICDEYGNVDSANLTEWFSDNPKIHNRLTASTIDYFSGDLSSCLIPLPYSDSAWAKADVADLLSRPSYPYGTNCGINSIASDEEGDVIIVSSGRNFLLDTYINPVVFNKTEFQAPDSLDVRKYVENVSYVSASAVSASGKYVALAVHSMKSTLLLLENKGNSFRLVRKCQVDASCNAMAFSGNEQWLIARTGHYIADEPTIVYRLSIEGNLFERLVPDEDCSAKVSLFVSNDGSLAWFSDSCKLYIADFNKKKIQHMGARVDTYICRSRAHLVEYPLVFLHRNEHHVFFSSESRRLMSYGLWTGECRCWTETLNGRKMIGIADDGEWVYLGGSVLSRMNLFTGTTEEYDLQDAEMAFPSYDDKDSIYVVHYIKGSDIYRVSLFDLANGMVVATYACPAAPFGFNVTARGLAFCCIDGSVHLISAQMS